MRTAIIATLLALGTLATLAPLAAAETDNVELIPICRTVAIRAGSTTVDAIVTTVTVTTRYTHIATVCVGP